MKCLGITSRDVRMDFSIPRGIIVSQQIDDWVKGNLKGRHVISVGDVVTETLVRNNIKPIVAVVDYKTRRALILPEYKAHLNEYEYINVRNPPGTISLEAIHILCNILSSIQGDRRVVVEVEGEEDMLALPIISCAPLCSIVVYGVPDVGIAAVHVTEETRYIASQRITYLEPVDCSDSISSV
ncbi:MAG: GTP-dependent dephospho-CoA kinase family protein [Desulfurococcales archaeon]|nr:GTP-dependent dephospho-CoA kinase family protein [Desulfurococcales archaeon]